MSRTLLETNETLKAFVNGDLLSEKTQKDNRRVSDQKATTADAGELYNGENYGKIRHKETVSKKSQEEAKAYDRKLKHNEISHKADNVNQDYANAEEIIRNLPSNMPDEVKGKTIYGLIEESHNDASDIGEMHHNVVKFHEKKTSEMMEHKKQESIQKIMGKFGSEETKESTQPQAEV